MHSRYQRLRRARPRLLLMIIILFGLTHIINLIRWIFEYSGSSAMRQQLEVMLYIIFVCIGFVSFFLLSSPLLYMPYAHGNEMSPSARNSSACTALIISCLSHDFPLVWLELVYLYRKKWSSPLQGTCCILIILCFMISFFTTWISYSWKMSKMLQIRFGEAASSHVGTNVTTLSKASKNSSSRLGVTLIYSPPYDIELSSYNLAVVLTAAGVMAILVGSGTVFVLVLIVVISVYHGVVEDASSDVCFAGFSNRPWVRAFFMNTFVHMNVLHLALNSFALANIGIMVESLVGTWQFLILYFCNLFSITVLVGLYYTIFQGSCVIGASAIIFALLSFWCCSKRENVDFCGFETPSVYVPWLTLALVQLLFWNSATVAHFIGIVCGMVSCVAYECIHKHNRSYQEASNLGNLRPGETLDPEGELTQVRIK